jgi:cytochrome c peroxidase
MRLAKISVILVFLVPLALVVLPLLPSARVVGQGSGLAAPTGVEASDGVYINKVGVSWDTIRGAASYRIFRNTVNNPATATDIGSTPAFTFFDTTATAGQTFFYWVRAENGSNVSNMSAADQGVRAVGTQQGPIPPLEPPPVPAGNPLTATKAYLGKTLFWDEQLSSTKTVSCGTCHIANRGGSDPRSVVGSLNSTNPGPDNIFNSADDITASPGVATKQADGSYVLSALYAMRPQVTGRKANSFVDAAYPGLLFWDGRATGAFRDPITNAVILNAGGALESQAAGPPLSSVEMAHSGRDWNQTATQIAVSKPLALASNLPPALETWIGGRSYPELFAEAFGTSDVTPARIIMAIATYERTLYSDRTPFDRVVMGLETLTAAEQRGRGVFNANGCNVCHGGNLFTDNAFHYTGVRPQNDDTGRFQVTGNNGNRGQFRTPSLRNVEMRGPFFHNGRTQTIENVVSFYNRGGDFNAPNKAPGVRPLGLTAGQQADLAAFMKRPLTDPRVANNLPPFDRPTLYTESNRVPEIIGAGVPGSGSVVPQPVALEPPLAGNTSFTVGMTGGLGGASAVLVIDSQDPGTGPGIPATAFFARRQVTLGGSGNGNGFASATLSIPNDVGLLGLTLWGRWYVNDLGAPGGVAVTPAFRFTVFGTAPTAGTVQFNSALFAASEGEGAALVAVTRTGNTDLPVTVDFNTSDSTAQQRTDYALSTGTLSFAAGESSKTFTVLITDDAYVEGNETINLNLTNATGGSAIGLNSAATITISDNDTTPPIINPTDAAGPFVTQHYHDFLARVPDAPGLDYWTNQITACGTDQSCINARRVGVSNAFFFEQEFQQTGAYVYRLYRAAFGNNQPFPNPDTDNQTEAKKLPGYAVFMADRARVVGGASLADSQLALANAFAQRQAFLAKYPNTLTGAQFVDALLSTLQTDLGVNLTSQRDILISQFNSGGRGAVLYRLADDNAQSNPVNNRAFVDAEYNRSFVFTQYGGYLRRDSDVAGYLFWLNVVNQFPLRSAASQNGMVCAFITSTEYQQRFSSVVTHSNSECGQ